MASKLCRFIITVVAGLIVSACLTTVIGCSGKGGVTTPNPRDAGIGEAIKTVPVITQSGNQARWIDGEVVVVVKDGIGDAQASAAFAAHQLRLKQTIKCRWGVVYWLTITDGTPVSDMVSRLKSDPAVRMADPNFRYPLCEAPYTPNDPMWAGPIPGTDPRNSVYDQWGPAMIGAPLVWNESKGSSDVIVAIIDTGVRKEHEDLYGTRWKNAGEVPDNGIDDDGNGYIDDVWGWNCVQDNGDPNDDGYYASYHGTACAGVVAATQDNHVGLTGVAPGCRIMACKTDLSDGTSDSYLTSVIKALEYARINGAKVCSMSFGTYDYSDILEAEFNDCWDDGNGMNLMAAAGNEDQEQLRYPAAYDAAMAIGAVIPQLGDGSMTPCDEGRISWSLGFYWGSCYGEKLEVMGYGDHYTTTHGAGSDTYWDGYSNGFFGGTSCATPMSAGVMALVHSFFPDKNAQWCRDRLNQTADDLGDVGHDIQTGNGRCNVLRAVYGSDRYKSQEDTNGFVTLPMPDGQLFDSLHDVPGNPYQDTVDLYKLTVPVDGILDLYLDIYTYGENLDIALYSDQAMTQLVDSGTVENHAGSSFEHLVDNVTAGQKFYVKVYSPGEGNSSTYGLHARLLPKNIWITGDSIVPPFIHQQGQKIPVLKLTMTVGTAATLNELIISKHGSLPNSKWVGAAVYKDSNDNGVFDDSDELVSENSQQGLNRLRLDGMSIGWDSSKSLVVFVTVDIGQTLTQSNASFSMESYKDLTTAEGIVADYPEFPINSGSITIGTDSTPPTWVTTTGIKSAQGSYHSAILGWNTAVDSLTPPVKYNVYYSDKLPFNFTAATKLSNVAAQQGTDTALTFIVPDLPGGTLLHFAVRAEDQAGNEEKNTVVKDATPLVNGDPSHPFVLNTYPLSDPQAVSLSGSLLVVADGTAGLRIFDRSDPVNPVQKSLWNGDGVVRALVDGHYAFCCGTIRFTSLDLSLPESPMVTDTVPFWDGKAVVHKGSYLYVARTDQDLVVPVDASDLGNLIALAPTALTDSGSPYDIAMTSGRMYVANYSTGVDSLALTDPEAPEKKASFGDGTFCTALAVKQGVLYSGTYSDGTLTSYDIATDPDSPPVLGSLTDGPGGNCFSIVIVGNYVYMARQSYGIVTFDISNPSDIKYVGALEKPGILGLATDGSIIYAVGNDQSAGSLLYVIV